MIRLSDYVFSTLASEPCRTLERGQAPQGNPRSILLAKTRYLETGCRTAALQLEREYKLADELKPEWAACPLSLETQADMLVLVLSDPGGECLERLVGSPRLLPGFLSLAIRLCNALRELHRCNLVHNDVRPANYLVTDKGAWLTGFGRTSRPTKALLGQQPWELHGGSLPYMAPEQTGRTDQQIDVRSDLYSLGVLLYEALTGQLPFRAADAMGWVHCHVAVRPAPVSTWLLERPPPVIEAILFKLLSKSPVERYQSAASLLADLQTCLDSLASRGEIALFRLGGQDRAARPLEAGKLYGRGPELDAVSAALERASSGAAEVIWVTGDAGVGKSTFVRNLLGMHKSPAVLLATGKFDHFSADTPYATLARAFEGVVRKILGGSDAALARWRQDLLQGLGSNGRLMTNLIPALGLVIGEQPEPAALGPREAQHRLFAVFRRMLRVFASPEHPLVLFLDDLHWADLPSIHLLGTLLQDANLTNFLLICAYRPGEGSEFQSRVEFIETMRSPGILSQEMALRALEPQEVAQMVSDMLCARPAGGEALAEVLYERTGGNPFYVLQSIRSLADHELLTLAAHAKEWQWDIARIRSEGAASNVGHLIAERVSRVSAPTLRMLALLACVGRPIDTRTLARCADSFGVELEPSLAEAAAAGLVQCPSGWCSFVHDRIHETAYELLPAQERPMIHLRIGRSIVAASDGVVGEDSLFEVASHCNRGLALIESEQEREWLARIDLRAGVRAKAATAYTSAWTFLDAGSRALEGVHGDDVAQLRFDLQLQTAECEFFSGDTLAADARLERISRLAMRLPDRVAVVRMRMALFTTLDRTGDAIRTGLEFLRLSGTDWPEAPYVGMVASELQEFRLRLGNRSVASLIHDPCMTDPECLAIMEVLAELQAPASFTNTNLFHLTILRMANLSLQKGLCDASPCAYALLNIILGHRCRDYTAGVQFGWLACDLVARPGLGRFSARVHMFFGTFVVPWTIHLRLARPMFRRAIDAMMTAGDPTYAAYTRRSLVSNLMTSGEPLAEVQREAEHALRLARAAKFGLLANSFLAMLLLIQELRGRQLDDEVLPGGRSGEQAFVRQLATGGERTRVPLARYWIYKMQAAVFAGNHGAGLAALKAAEALIDVSEAFIEFADFHCFAAMIRAVECDRAPREERARLQALIAEDERLLQQWSAACEENFKAKALVVSAELARLEGRQAEAERLYERAVGAAAASGQVHIEGLCSELTADFHMRRGLGSAANLHLGRARLCYDRWGAEALVRRLHALRPDDAHAADAQVPGRQLSQLGQLNVTAMLRASQALVSEVDPTGVITVLMRIAVEHAAADRGVLVLLSGGQAFVAARAEVVAGTVRVLVGDAPVQPDHLPLVALRYVLRTRESLSLDQPGFGAMLAGDDYLQAGSPRSFLCVPMVKHAQVTGAIYVENNLAVAALNPETRSVLEFIAGQAAVALDNAHLYSALRRNESFLAEGQRLSNTGTWSRELATGKLVWSEQTFRIFGLDPGSGPPSFDEFTRMIHPDDLDTWRETVSAAVRQCTGFAHEIRIVLPTGQIRILQSVARPVVNADGGVTEYLGTTMDITDRKSREDALRQVQAELAHATRLTTVGALAASIAHEVNQPLAAIMANAEAALLLLAKTPKDVEGVRASVGRIVRDSRQAGDVIKSMRAMLRRSTPTRLPLDLNLVIRDAVDLFRGDLRLNAITTDLRLRDGIEAVVGDRVQLTQVLIILVKNSLDSMLEVPKGQRHLTIASDQGEPDGVVVRVEDTGAGIAADALPRMFESFFTTKSGGMGLGLSICKSIVESHGGTVVGSRREPCGSRFTFSIRSPLAH